MPNNGKSGNNYSRLGGYQIRAYVPKKSVEPYVFVSSALRGCGPQSDYPNYRVPAASTGDVGHGS